MSVLTKPVSQIELEFTYLGVKGVDRVSQENDPNKNCPIVHESGCLLNRNNSFGVFGKKHSFQRAVEPHLRYSLRAFQATFQTQIIQALGLGNVHVLLERQLGLRPPPKDDVY